MHKFYFYNWIIFINLDECIDIILILLFAILRFAMN